MRGNSKPLRGGKGRVSYLNLSHKLPQGVTEVHAQILVPIKIMIIYHLGIWFYLQWNWIH